MKSVKVGRYVLGGCAVEVWFAEQDYFSAHNDWTKTGYGRINLARETGEGWAGVVQGLTHEAFEFSLHSTGCAYQRTKFTRLFEHSSQNYRFMFTHEEFQTMAKEVGDFLCYALPDVATVWNKWNKRRGKVKT